MPGRVSASADRAEGRPGSSRPRCLWNVFSNPWGQANGSKFQPLEPSLEELNIVVSATGGLPLPLQLDKASLLDVHDCRVASLAYPTGFGELESFQRRLNPNDDWQVVADTTLPAPRPLPAVRWLAAALHSRSPPDSAKGRTEGRLIEPCFPLSSGSRAIAPIVVKNGRIAISRATPRQAQRLAKNWRAFINICPEYWGRQR